MIVLSMNSASILFSSDSHNITYAHLDRERNSTLLYNITSGEGAGYCKLQDSKLHTHYKQTHPSFTSQMTTLGEVKGSPADNLNRVNTLYSLGCQEMGQLNDLPKQSFFNRWAKRWCKAWSQIHSRHTRLTLHLQNH